MFSSKLYLCGLRSNRVRLSLLFASIWITAFSLTATAQSLNYPYNPDSDTDENIGTPDLLTLLSVFGSEFLPDPIAIDSLTLEEYLQLLQQSIAAANYALDAIPSPECDPCDGLSEVTFGTTTYPVVPIGCECWFAKNLDTYVFANGDVIPALDDVDLSDPPNNHIWQAWANNNPIDGVRYGRMYSAGARSDARKICPSGWKVPNHDDAYALEDAVDAGNASVRLLALPYDAQTGVDYIPNVDATNDFGFNGIPISSLQTLGGNGFSYINTDMNWGGANQLVFGYISGFNNFSISNSSAYSDAHPVRCVKYQDNDLGCTDPNYLEFERNAEFDDGSCLTLVVRGCTDPEANNYNPEANTDVASCVYGLQPPACDFESNYTYQGVSYPLVEVAGRCWFGENLRTDSFNNGDAIEAVEQGTTEAAMPWYTPYEAWIPVEFDESFGYSYNQAVILDDRNVCPSGWHISNKSDWDELASAFDGYVTLLVNVASMGTINDASGFWNIGVTNQNGTGLNVHPLSATHPFGPASFGGPGNDAIFALNDGHVMWGFQFFDSAMGMITFHMEGANEDPNEIGVAIRCVKD